MAGYAGLSLLAPQLQNAPPTSQDVSTFLSFLSARSKPKTPRVPTPAEQIGTSQNSALFGGNMLSPAFSAIFKAFG